MDAGDQIAIRQYGTVRLRNQIDERKNAGSAVVQELDLRIKDCKRRKRIRCGRSIADVSGKGRVVADLKGSYGTAGIRQNLCIFLDDRALLDLGMRYAGAYTDLIIQQGNALQILKTPDIHD